MLEGTQADFAWSLKKDAYFFQRPLRRAVGRSVKVKVGVWCLVRGWMAQRGVPVYVVTRLPHGESLIRTSSPPHPDIQYGEPSSKI